MKAATARDLSANREAATEALTENLASPIATVLYGWGFDNDAASVYADMLADVVAEQAIAHLAQILDVSF